jgi:DNA repair protein RadC
MTRYAYRLETRRVKEDDFKYKTGQFTSPEKVKEFLQVLDNFDNEQFVALLLDNKNKLTGIYRQSGTIDQTAVYVREVAKHALLSGAASVILAHNHPSGSVTPSNADREITKALKDGLELLQIKVHDHFIIGSDDKTFSFAEEGLL